MQAMKRGWGRVLGLLLGLLLCLPTVHAAVDVQISQNPVYLGDTFTLTLSAEGGSGGEPDLAPLRQDFEVRGTGTSSRMSFINGRMTARVEWRIELRARRSGDLTIPALQVGSERSRAIALKVTDTPLAGDPKSVAAGEHVHIDMRIEPGGGNPYVQQQIPLLVRFYLDEAVRKGKYSEPQIADAVVERVGQERRYSTQRNGRRYQVIERRYAVFPQKSGDLRIPPVRFEGEIRDQAPDGRSRPRPLRDDLFGDDPFFKGGILGSDPFDDVFGEDSRPVRKFSSALTVKVRPPAVAQDGWLPASAVRLRDSWADAPPQLKAGQPVTRTITIEAEGLTGAQIPQLDFPVPPGTRIYREPIDNTTRAGSAGLIGVSRQSVTYIPSNAGDLTLPEMALDWWDIGRDAAATATVPAWGLKVLPGDGRTAGTPMPDETTVPGSDGQRAAATSTAVKAERAQSWGERLSDRGWQVGGLLLLLALLALVWWLMRRRRQAGRANSVSATRVPSASMAPVSRSKRVPSIASEAQAPVQDASTLMRSLETACRDQDAEAAARALLALAKAHRPDQAPRSLGELADRLSEGGDEVRALDRALYGPVGDSWPGDRLWQVLRDGLTFAQPPRETSTADALPPLYPGHG